ncbi:MAG: stage II sporulation protein P, partial [Angelakisella sp.]
PEASSSPASSVPPPPSSSASSSPEAEPSPPPSSAAEVGEPPEIPRRYQAPLLTLAMVGEAGNPAFLQWNDVWLRNYTKLAPSAIEKILERPAALQIPDTDEPQVLIYHTHTTESYEQYDSKVYDTRNSWRDTDNTNNMAAVGEVLAEELRAHGISVLHDTEQHDHPTYNGAYDRSRDTVKAYLAKYPTISVTIDLHRDGIIRSDNTVLKPIVEVEGKKAAQLMIIAPCDDGSVGVPHWKENLRFACELQQTIDCSVPDLCRPIFFCYRNYNLGLTDASLLFELGTNGNTLEEAKYTAKLIAEPFAETLRAHME